MEKLNGLQYSKGIYQRDTVFVYHVSMPAQDAPGGRRWFVYPVSAIETLLCVRAVGRCCVCVRLANIKQGARTDLSPNGEKFSCVRPARAAGGGASAQFPLANGQRTDKTDIRTSL